MILGILGLGGSEVIIILLILISIPILFYTLGFKSGKKAGYIQRTKETENKKN